jgi:hypothetical protein
LLAEAPLQAFRDTEASQQLGQESDGLRVVLRWYQALNETPGRVGPPIGRPPASIRQYFIDWLEKDGHPFWPFWENIRSWWQIRDLPNLMLLHFGQLKADLPGQIRRIAAFLDIEVDERRWPAIVEHCGFDYMKAHATKSVPLGGAFWHGGARPSSIRAPTAAGVTSSARRTVAGTRRQPGASWAKRAPDGSPPATCPARVTDERLSHDLDDLPERRGAPGV